MVLDLTLSSFKFYSHLLFFVMMEEMIMQFLLEEERGQKWMKC